MTNKLIKNKILIISIISILFFLIQIFMFVPAPNKNVDFVNATTEFDSISVTNQNFNSSTSSYLQSSPSGWTAVDSSFHAVAGVISTLDSTFATYHNYTTTSSYSYQLNENDNPGKYHTSQDNFILMINGKENYRKYGFTNSTSINLSANSYYVFNIKMKTINSALGSIYLSGLSEQYLSDEHFINLNATNWTECIFAVATGEESQSIKIELWLGSKLSQSNGAVFFDNIEVNKVSASLYQNTINYPQTNLLKTRIINLQNTTNNLTSNFLTNANFDNSGNLPLALNSSDASASLVDVINSYQFNDLTANNKKAFSIENIKLSATGYGYKDITINRYGIYKISLNAKIISTLTNNGALSLKIVEQENDNHPDEYIPNTVSFSITSNTENKTMNNFNNYSFYIKGNGLFDTKINLEIWLGTIETKTKGQVILDNIKIEGITTTQYNSATDSNFIKKLDLTTSTSTPTIANGHFNNFKLILPYDPNTNYPLQPESWTNDYNEVHKDQSICSIVNTQLYPLSELGVNNPGNPSGFVDTNNILVLQNKVATYQSITSQNFTLSSNTTYELSFDVYTLNNNFSGEVYDSDSVLLTSFSNINTSASWKNYKILFKISSENQTINIKFNLGKNTSPINGTVFIDNVKLITKNYTDEIYTNLVNSINDRLKVVDFVNGLWNITNNQSLYAFDVYSTAEGYLVKALNENDSLYIENENTTSSLFKTQIFIENINAGTTTLTSRFTESFVGGSFYKITIDIYTLNIQLNNSDETNFGVKFEFNNISETFSKIESNGNFTTYTFYIRATETISSNLKLSLISDNDYGIGSVIFSNYQIDSSITSEEFNQAYASPLSNTIVIGETVANIDEDITDNGEVSSVNINDQLWLLIPSIILGVMVIFVLASFYLRKIKFKKFEIKRKSSYDRTKTLENYNAKREAELKRDMELAKLEQELINIQNEINAYEEEYQKQLQEYRVARAQHKADKKVEKQLKIEKKFKEYSQNRNKLQNKSDTIKGKISEISKEDYLLKQESVIKKQKLTTIKKSTNKTANKLKTPTDE